MNRPTADGTTSGGAIDVDNRPVFTQLAANDTLEMVSSQAGDTTQSVTVTGRLATGVIDSEAKTVNGVSVVSFTHTLERVLKVLMNADATGIITIRRASTGPTVGTIPVGERGFYAMFYDSASSTTGSTSRYEKIFWKNTHGTLTLTNAKVRLSADPASVIQQGICTAKDDSTSVADRLSAPGGVSFVDDNVDQDVPSTTLAAGEAIGVWYRLDLAQDNAPIKNTFTTRLAGTTV